MAFGHNVSAAPISPSSSACSSTSTVQPARSSATAAARPPIPAPATTA